MRSITSGNGHSDRLECSLLSRAAMLSLCRLVEGKHGEFNLQPVVQSWRITFYVSNDYRPESRRGISWTTSLYIGPIPHSGERISRMAHPPPSRARKKQP